MTFEYPWVLACLLLPLVWAAYQWRRADSRLRLAVKALTFAAVLAALAEPRLSVPQTRVAVSVLVDTSASVTPQDLARASRLATDIERSRGRNLVQVIPFARGSRNASDAERNGAWQFRNTAGDAGRGTDLEAAIRDAIAAAPSGAVPRVALISDGNENHGSVARAAWLSRQLGIAVDTFPMAGRPRPNLRVETVTLPTLAFTGERFPIEVAVSSPQRAQATIEVSAEGKILGSAPASLAPGLNQVRVHAAVNVPGAVDIAGVIRTGEFGVARFEQAVTLRRPRVLFLSIDPVGTESHLLGTLKASQFDVQHSTNLNDAKLGDYQLVVLNNWDLEAIPAARKNALEEYVKQGGGLLVIGGERNIYAENKKVEDPLDRTLPAKLAPPRTPEGTLVVLIVDKSSSMEGRKMELARLAAIGVIDNLRPVDTVGVLIFDNSFQWAVPIRRAEDRTLIKRLVAGITPDGGTQIAPALAEAYRKTVPQSATYKHVVLLTDGISEEGDSMTLAREAAAQRITISTVGLGQDVNRAYLEKVASFSKGKSYFLNDPSGLEQILLKDVMEHTGSTAVEKPIVPVVMTQSELLAGVGMETAPPLRGYIKFIAKPTADLILSVDRKDPLFIHWQYGLGRSAVFASDAKARWAEKWVTWPGFDRFWVNVFRDLLPRSESGETRAHFDSSTSKLVVEYHLAQHVPEPVKIPDIYAFGPGGFQQPMQVKKIAGGVYRGELAVGARQGLFRIRPLEESRAFAETGVYRQEEEMIEYGSNEPLLRKVAEFTGGRFNPAPSRVFDGGGRSVPSVLELWPVLLALAIGLNIAELVARKWRAILQTLRGVA